MDSDEQDKGLGVPPAPEACRRLLEAVGRGGIGLALTDATDRFVYVNDTHSRIYGHSREETLGKTWRDFVPPETVQAHEEAGRRAFERGEVYHSEAPGIRADGTTGRYEVADVPLADPGQPYTGHVCIIRDVTERVGAEEALRQSEERYRDLVENSEDIIWSIDERGHITYVNPAVEKVLDIPAAEITGRHYSEFLTPSHRAETTALFEQVLSGRQLRQELATLPKLTGGVAYVSVNAKAIRAPDGRVLGAWGTARDVTERKLAEEALRQSEERFRDLVENSGDIIWSVDGRGRFTYVNPAVERILGLAAADLVGHGFAEFLAPGEEEKSARLFRQVLSGQQLEPYEVVFRTPGGESVHLSICARAVRNGQGRIVGAQGTARDVTEKVRAEEKLALYRDIIANSSEAITILGLEGRYVEQNAAHAALLGHSDEELRGRTPALHVGEEAFVRMLEAVTATGRYRGEVRARAKDGRSLTLDLSVFVVRDAAGRPVCYVGMKRDVTERVRAEEELTHYRHRLEELVEERTGELQEAVSKLEEEVAERARAEKEIRSLARFPSENPNPVLRVSPDFTLLYANEASQPVLDAWRFKVGQPIPEPWRERVARAFRTGVNEQSELACGQRTFAFTFTPIGTDYVNLYGLDITERVRAEEALRESEQRYHALFANNHAVMLLIDPETGRIVDANPAAWLFYGYTKEELTAKQMQEINTLSPEEVLAEMHRARTWQRNLFIFRHRLADGQVRDVEVYSGPIHVAGKPLLYSIVHDITERARADEALADQARLMEAVFENSHALLVYLDRDFNFVRVNEAYAQACARSKGEMIGRNHFELYPHEANQAIFERVRDTGEPYNVVARPFTFPDHPEWGETYWDWRLTPVKGGNGGNGGKGGNDAGGRVEGFVFSLFDVTERVRRLRELELARQRIEVLARREEQRASWLATILDQLPVGVIIASAPEGRVVISNRAAAQISGVGPAYVPIEDYGQRWRFLTPEGEAVPGEELPLARAVRSGEEFVGQEITLLRPDGRKVPLIFNALPLRDEGKVVGGMVVFWDVTQQKETQRRLEEASRLKDEFLSMASHELKTPVTSIKIYAELAARHPEVVKERFPQLMATLGRQADQLVSLVNDLLDVSRLQMGRMPLNRQRLDLAALVDEICQRSRPVFEGRPLSCNLGRGPVLVEADPLRLEQVFQNLLDNAAKYSPEGGAIEVRVGRREDKALVEVVDRGIGIAPEVLPHVFERFFKPRAQQAVYGGLGLGLYICKELVERHGGRIWAESSPGQGSTFYVELPLAGEA